MQFEGAVYRWRRELIPNPYNPDRPEYGPWADAEVVRLEGAAVLSSSDYSLRSEGRDVALSAKSLFLDSADADVQRGDGISLVAGGLGPEFTVTVVPRADVNPFTGWCPVREVPLSGASG